ncbi:MAG: carbohydrate ABC transporter permease [Candidatus Ornithospirochaeta sp.]
MAKVRKLTPWQIITYTILCVLTVIVMVPFVWMIMTSLQPDTAHVLKKPVTFPVPPAFRNYIIAWNTEPFDIYTVNSLFVSISATLLQIITAILAAYAFAALSFKGKNVCFILVLAVLMMPSQVSVIPMYKMISTFGWLDSYWALIIPFAADAYGIFLIRQNFMALPKDYAEAAKIEGASHLRIAFQVYARLSVPSLIAFAIMAFKWRWNDYFWTIIFTSSVNKRTLPVGIVMMKEVSDGGTQWHILMAATLIVLLPMIVLYLCLQKYFTNDYLKGGLKG